MPTINLPKKKKHIKQGRTKEAYDLYNTSQWKNLRRNYFILHPLCEECLKRDIIKPTEEIHHIKPILTGKTKLEMESLAYDPNNLIALCKECHHKQHSNYGRTNKT